MGRALMRVPMDFNWPRHKVWGGYLNPFRSARIACPACDGKGYSPEARQFSDEWYGFVPFDPAAYGATPLSRESPVLRQLAVANVQRSPAHYMTQKELQKSATTKERVFNHFYTEEETASAFVRPFKEMEAVIYLEMTRLHEYFAGQWSKHLVQADVDALLAADRLWDFTHVPRTEAQRAVVEKRLAEGHNSWLPESNGYVPSADEVNAWALIGFGHDSFNANVCVSARCERLGVPTECARCAGSGHLWSTPAAQERYEKWTREEPPEGPGFQLWETTSEGSPTSPVFGTLEELCTWAAANATTFGSHKTSAAGWRRMLDDGLVVHEEKRPGGGTNVFL